MSKCRSCGAYIEFVKTSSGKNMPVNEGLHYYKPRTWEMRGLEKYITTSGVVKTGRRIKIDEPTEGAELGYRVHWETCPDAGKHRTRG